MSTDNLKTLRLTADELALVHSALNNMEKGMQAIRDAEQPVDPSVRKQATALAKEISALQAKIIKETCPDMADHVDEIQAKAAAAKLEADVLELRRVAIAGNGQHRLADLSLDDWRPAGGERRHLLRRDVDTDNLMAELGKASAGDRPDIASTKYGNAHIIPQAGRCRRQLPQLCMEYAVLATDTNSEETIVEFPAGPRPSWGAVDARPKHQIGTLAGCGTAF